MRRDVDCREEGRKGEGVEGINRNSKEIRKTSGDMKKEEEMRTRKEVGEKGGGGGVGGGYRSTRM